MASKTSADNAKFCDITSQNAYRSLYSHQQCMFLPPCVPVNLCMDSHLPSKRVYINKALLFYLPLLITTEF